MDYKSLVEEILRQRPDLTHEQVISMIGEKKRKVGAGYLSDSGGAWLVAAELGVEFSRNSLQDIPLKEIYVGANEITVSGRILALYPPRTYKRKDSSEGKYQRLILFDTAGYAKLTVWDDRVDLIKTLNLRPDVTVRVEKAYVRAGLDGRPILNLGKRGSLSPFEVEDQSRFPRIENISIEIADLKGPGEFLSIHGILQSPPRRSEFVRKDGSKGRVTHMNLTSKDQSRQLRVVVWDPDLKEIQETPHNFLIRVVNLRTKNTPHGDIELHGDESTWIALLGEAPVPAVGYPRPNSAPKRILRILTVGPTRMSEKGNSSQASALVVDDVGNYLNLIVRGGAHDKLLSLKEDSVISCQARQLSNESLYCDDQASIAEEEGEDHRYVKAQDLYRKLNQIGGLDTPLSVEIVALSRTVSSEITTRDGSSVRRAELLVGDDTAEVRVVAWRNITEELEGISPGQRLRLRGIVAKEDRNGILLQLRSYSKVEKVT